MKKAIKILFIVLAIVVALSLVGLFAFLSFGRAGGEIGFDAVINRVEPEYNMAYATVTDQDAGFFSKKLPESIMFNTSDLDVELKAGDEIQGCYLSGTISGDSVRVVSVMVKEKKTATDGTITFYTEPVREAQSQKDAGTIEERLHRDLTYEETRKLIKIIDDVDEWVDDHSVDRLAYYFDGAFWLYEKDHVFYFTYEYNVIYYDHYFAEIPAEDMQYIKDLGAECVELPDKTAQDQVSVDGDFGFAFKLVEGTFARGERICLSVVLTNQQNESYVWTGPQSHYRARVKLVNTNGTDEYTISPEPIPDTDDMGDYQVPSNEARSFEYYFCIPSDAVSGEYSLICSFDTSSQTFNDVFNLE